MQGGIAQTIGLVLAVNGRLRGLESPRFWPDGSIFTFCNAVRFVGRKRQGFLGSLRDIAVDDPPAWLNTLPPSATGARLRVLMRNDPGISDRDSVAFSGGGPIFLTEVIDAVSTAEAWFGEWRVSHSNAADRRIWSVTYRNVAPTLSGAPREVSPTDNLRAELEKVLLQAIEFSSTQKMGFEKNFKRALFALDTADPLNGFYHMDMIPDGLMELEYRQIMSCCALSWVFGGMGSWNDVMFRADEQKTYEALSDRLFLLIIEGLIAATNSTARMDQ